MTMVFLLPREIWEVRAPNFSWNAGVSWFGGVFLKIEFFLSLEKGECSLTVENPRERTKCLVLSKKLDAMS